MQLCLDVCVCVCVCVSACLRAYVCVCVCLCHTHTVPQWRSGLPAGCLVADGLIALYWATQLCQRARACISHYEVYEVNGDCWLFGDCGAEPALLCQMADIVVWQPMLWYSTHNCGTYSTVVNVSEMWRVAPFTITTPPLYHTTDFVMSLTHFYLIDDLGH